LNYSDGDFATLSPGVDETYLPLPVLQEEVAEEEGFICIEPEENFGSLNEQSIVTISIDEYSTLDSGCILRAIDSTPPQDAVVKPLVVLKSTTTGSRAAKSQKEPKKEKSCDTSAGASKGRTGSRKRQISDLDKESDEYRDKRDKNNESVRKSRDKARQRQEETEGRLQTLADENQRLQDRVDSLEKELSILRGLFTNVGAAVPREVDGYLDRKK